VDRGIWVELMKYRDDGGNKKLKMKYQNYKSKIKNQKEYPWHWKF